MTVLPFRRRPKNPAPASEPDDPDRCPDCGWKLPTELAVPAHVQADGTFPLYLRCPECGARLVVPVGFRDEA